MLLKLFCGAYWEMAMLFVRPSKLVPSVALVLLVMGFIHPAFADTSSYSFQQGSNGYSRAQDTSIRWAYGTNFGTTAEGQVEAGHKGDPGAYEMWSTGAGRTSVLEVGQFFQSVLGGVGGGVYSLEAGPAYRYSRMYIRFRDVFGTGAGQVPTGIPVASATLRLYNTEDLGAEGSAGGAFLGETVSGPDGVTLDNVYGEPKLNAGTIAVYPSLIPITFGFDDGTAKKGRVTAKERRRGKQSWAQGQCSTSLLANDPVAMAIYCGPADFDNPLIAAGANEIDSSHAGAITVAQNADEGFKDFDVTGLVDFITGNGVYITALSPTGALPTLDLNYGNAYRSSEFGDAYDKDENLISAATAADIATRPMLIIELVPEPATAALVSIGGLALLRRRR